MLAPIATDFTSKLKISFCRYIVPLLVFNDTLSLINGVNTRSGISLMDHLALGLYDFALLARPGLKTQHIRIPRGQPAPIFISALNEQEVGTWLSNGV